jgi:iron complex outermembrane receptor protein
LLLGILGGLLMPLMRTHAEQAAIGAIAPQPLAQAVAAFARQTGLQVVFVSGDVDGITSVNVAAGLSPREAMTQLLQGTGLSFEFLNERTVRIFRRIATESSQSVNGGAGSGADTANTQGETLMDHRDYATRLGTVLVLCGGVALLPGNVCAEDAGVSSQPVAELEEVIVTAEKRESNLQKTAISIQTYSGVDLKAQSKTRIDDIMSGVVGVNVQDSPVAQFFYMRGVEAMPTGTGALQSPSVAVLIDGVYQNRGETVRGGTLDLARAEVMRGTQSTTLGANALSGAVSLVSNVPVFEYQGNGSIELGNYHLQSAEGVLNIPLTGSQALRLAYSSNKRNGFYSSGAGESDLQNARLKYRWRQSDKLDVVFTVSHQAIGGNSVSNNILLAQGHWLPFVATQNVLAPDNTNDTNAALAGVQGDADSLPDTIAMGQLYITPGTTTSTQCALVTAATSATIPGAVVTADGCPAKFVAVNDGVYYKDRSNPWDDGYAFNQWPNHPFSDTDITSYSADFTLQTGIGTLTVSPSVQHTQFQQTGTGSVNGWSQQSQNQNTEQLDARLASGGTSRLTWLTGVYYYHANSDGYFENVVYPGTGMAPATGVVDPTDCRASMSYCFGWMSQGAEHTSASLYGNATLSITDTLRLIGGARYSHDKRAFYQNQNLNVAPAALGSSAIPGTLTAASTPYQFDCLACTGDRTWSKTTYRVGLEYDVLPRSMAYVTYATGYQPGSITSATKIVTNGVVTQNGTAAQELQQITVGIKNRFLDNRLQLNIEAFDSNFKHREVTIPAAELVAGNAALLCVASLTVNNGYRAVVTDTTGCLAFAGTATSDAYSRGVDLEANFLATASDRIDFSTEYLSAGYGSAPTLTSTASTAAAVLAAAGITAPTAAQTANAGTIANAFNANIGAFEGITTQNAPKWSASASYQHEFHLPGGSVLTPRLTGTYKSQYWTAFGTAGAANLFAINQSLGTGDFRTEIQRGYSLFDAFLAWRTRDGRFNASTYMKNIANKPILINSSGNFVTLASPRTFGVIFSATL